MDMHLKEKVPESNCNTRWNRLKIRAVKADTRANIRFSSAGALIIYLGFLKTSANSHWKNTKKQITTIFFSFFFF